MGRAHEGGQNFLLPPASFKSVELWVETLKKDKEFIHRANAAGCLVDTGTDYVLLAMVPGLSLWREMEIFSDAGLPPVAVLKATTWNGAYVVGRSDHLEGRGRSSSR